MTQAPRTLSHLGPGDIGKTFLFQLIGGGADIIWGTGVYTSDSPLATAAVHAGVLAPGEHGMVKVEIVDATQVPIEGSLQNGVQSHPWGRYPVGYRISRA